jgi:hypothetical protein
MDRCRYYSGKNHVVLLGYSNEDTCRCREQYLKTTAKRGGLYSDPKRVFGISQQNVFEPAISRRRAECQSSASSIFVGIQDETTIDSRQPKNGYATRRSASDFLSSLQRAGGASDVRIGFYRMRSHCSLSARCRPFFVNRAGHSPPPADQVNGCPFGFILLAQNEHIYILSLCYQRSIAGTHQLRCWIK